METSSESDGDVRTPRAIGSTAFQWRQHSETSVQSCVIPILRTRAPDACSDEAHALDTALVWRAQFSSQCEHHLLPFYGTLYIVVHGSRSCSPALSPALVQDIVNLYSRRLQIQERITHEVAEAVQSLCGPDDGLMVVCDSAHMCMVARGVEKHASSSVTSAARGVFEVDKRLQMAVLEQIVDATQCSCTCRCACR
jgi:GTP cyclohydrolase I